MFDVGGALIVARAAFVVAAMAAFGSALFPFYADGCVDRQECIRCTRALVLGAALLVLFWALVWLAFVIVEFGGTDAASFASITSTILFETDFGPIWLVRLAIALLLVFVAAWRGSMVASLGLAAIVLGSQAWIGHAAVGGAAHRVVQIAHLLPAGAWLGGLLPLALVLRGAAPKTTKNGQAFRILTRFSTVGVICVGFILVSGLFNMWLVIGRVPDFSDLYERIFAMKLIFLAAIFSIAIINRFCLLKKIEKSGDNAAIIGFFQLSIVSELMIGIAIIIAASAMGQTSPQS